MRNPSPCGVGRASAVRRAVGAGLATLGLGSAVGCGDDGSAEVHAPSPVTVEVLRVDPQRFVDTAVFSGQLDADRATRCSSPTRSRS